MVKRKKTSSAVEEYENGMTAGLKDGVDDTNNSGRKLDGCDEESGDQGSDERSTKRDGMEIHTLSTTGCTSSAPVITTSVSNPSGPCSSQQPRSSTARSHDQHHFLRSSVRPPSKRIRKDSIAPTINGHNGAKSKGSENGPFHQVSAGQSGSTGPSGKAAPRGQGPGDKEEPVGSQKRPRRQWESWSAEDKNSFFEGLYEHGKDFEAIQTNIALKHKKKGKPASMVKNKEQVRHFYYRTWHKISKHINFANVYSRVLKKSSQELYGLLCYAELRKKVGGLMDDKNVAKLNELIQQGATTVRSKGRNLRIKAPMCRALKRLCDPDGVSDEEDQKPVRLPLKVAVELQPRSNHSWARVQSLAHNPRLRMVVELHRKVSSLIEFLKQKWDVQDQLILKSLQEREALEGTQQHSGSGSPALPSSADEDLFLYPAETSTLTALPSVARVVHSKASCTVHWQESGKPRPVPKELIPTAQILGIQGAPLLLLPRGGVAKPGRGGGGDARRVGGETPVSTPEGGTSGGGAGPEHKNLNQITSPPPVCPLPSPSSLLLLSLAQKQEGSAAVGQVEGEKGLGGGPGVGKAFGAKEGDGDSNSQGQGGGSCSATEPCQHDEQTPGVNDSASPERNALPLLDPLVPTTPPHTMVPRQVEDVPPDQGQGWSAAPGKEECDGGSTPTPVSGGRSAQRICDEGWSSRGSDSNVTLAELYLMLGKPGKLQLVYEWQPAAVAAPELGEEGLQGPGQTYPQLQSPRPLPPLSTHRVLHCLLRLVSSEVNPKPAPELCSTATSPVKPSQEEQFLTPPGKAPAVGVVTSRGLYWCPGGTQMVGCLPFQPPCPPTAPDTPACSLPTRRPSSPSDNSSTPSACSQTFSCRNKGKTGAGHFESHSWSREPCSPAPLETLLNTSAPSPSSPTHLPLEQALSGQSSPVSLPPPIPSSPELRPSPLALGCPVRSPVPLTWQPSQQASSQAAPVGSWRPPVQTEGPSRPLTLEWCMLVLVLPRHSSFSRPPLRFRSRTDSPLCLQEWQVTLSSPRPAWPLCWTSLSRDPWRKPWLLEGHKRTSVTQSLSWPSTRHTTVMRHPSLLPS
ncbi:protein cramped-like isoform X4 [Oncorhynchus tshawytscha]|uniref:protein cramped-like isoform X4 n=1 Tax=Oncorhynchus tshawytscha TaxID=74940 RepID=UPI000D098FD1|nr:protein cramped-like isoform X4 [Oncorhynchus tshawytscha]